MKEFNRDEKFIIRGEFYMFFLLGVYTLMVGTMVPFLRREYGISYEMSGYLLSANSIGIITMGLVASYSAILLGLKRAYMIQHALVIIGLIVVTVSGNYVILVIGMVLMGLSSASTSNYSNQISNDISKSDSRIMNLMGVFFAVGACVTPYLVFFSSDTAGNWRYANYIVAVAAVFGILITYRMKLGRESAQSGHVKRAGYSFFRLKKFWVMVIALFSYSSVEVAMMGWLVTYFMDGQKTSDQFASLMATIFWVSILVGRTICSVIAKYISKAKLILFLSVGTAIFTAVFISNISLNASIAATIGLGLFMAGIYSTIISDAGHIFSEYKLAFGFFVTMAWLGPIIMPAVVGIISERHDVLTGIRVIAVGAFVFLVVSIWNVMLDRKGVVS